MLIGKHLRALREAKKLSQGDIEKRTGLLRPYLSRIENGHTIPSVETLEKWAHALEVPLYQLFYDGAEAPKLPRLPNRVAMKEVDWGRSQAQIRFWRKLKALLARMTDRDRKLLLHMLLKMARRK